MSEKRLKVALVGKPNTGKSSLFNELTGLNQKIANFPGVTVEKKTGLCKISSSISAEIIDLPGIYSLYPRSLDERVVFDILTDPAHTSYPDIALVIVDASNLKRSLLLFTQIRDLGIPVILALNMLDVAFQEGIQIDIQELKKQLNVEIIPINARKGKGIEELKITLTKNIQPTTPSLLFNHDSYQHLVTEIKKEFSISNDYLAFLYTLQTKYIQKLSTEEKKEVDKIAEKHNFVCKIIQAEELIYRYEQIEWIVKKSTKKIHNRPVNRFTNKLDQLLIHKIAGYIIFLVILFLIFQAIFSWATIPMNWIDQGIAQFNFSLKNNLPKGPLVNLLTDGIITGLGGILIFIPQIAILFGFISILEETGYMARVVFLMDKIMRRFGLNGRSVIPLISGVACAIPAIMATRTIQNRKERLITIFVTPLMSCSARIPVYTILIALVIPNQTVGFGLVNLQGLTLMGLYILGFAMALISAWFLKLIIKKTEKTYLIMELPTYKMPRWKHVALYIIDRVKSFVGGAGKIIIAISIILWVLASYGPGNKTKNAEKIILEKYATHKISKEILTNKIEAYKLEHSYAGLIGKTIEPAIKPLGFDWKMGIALVTSFAAREVFVSTMSTIYSIGKNTDNQETIKERMKSETDPQTGKSVYTPARAFSLLIFYVFALQCMSTIAVTYRETKTWKWPFLQFFYMTGLAYLASLFVYQLMK